MAKAVGGMTQKEIVFGFLNQGIEKPSEIVQAAREQYGIEIGKGNINQIKMAWKRQLGANAPQKGTRAPAVPGHAIPSPAVISSTSISAIEAILDLVELVGVAKARAIIASLR